MSKPVKAMITAELRKRYADATGACVVDLTGMNVTQQEHLRSSLRAKNARLEVVKNSLARLSLQGTPLEPLGKALEGPCALVTSSESLIDVAKVLVQAAAEHEQLKLKQAMIEGDAALLTVEQLSKMLGLRELLEQVAMLVSSPGRALAACMRAPQAKLAGCLKTIAEGAA